MRSWMPSACGAFLSQAGSSRWPGPSTCAHPLSLPAPSLSSSMQSLSSGSSPASLASSRGSLAASSLDSSASASFTDLYYDPFEPLDSELQSKVEFLLLEGATGFRPSGCITTIHEDEVAKTQKAEGGGRLQALRSLSGTPKSMSSLSPRSSLSSPSPPCSPLIADPLLAGDAFLNPLELEDPELSATLCELSLGSSSGEPYRLEEARAEGQQAGQGREHLLRGRGPGGGWGAGASLRPGSHPSSGRDCGPRLLLSVCQLFTWRTDALVHLVRIITCLLCSRSWAKGFSLVGSLVHQIIVSKKLLRCTCQVLCYLCEWVHVVHSFSQQMCRVPGTGLVTRTLCRGRVPVPMTRTCK